MHRQKEKAIIRKQFVENWSSTWNSTANSCSRWTPKLNTSHCLWPIWVTAFLVVSKLSEEEEQSSHLHKSSTGANSWNNENSHSHSMLWFLAMTDLTLRAEGQLHTCNLVSKYRKAHSSILEKNLYLARGREK